jgi:hypothetical protein
MPTGTAASPADTDEGFDLQSFMAAEWPMDDEEDLADAGTAASPAEAQGGPAPESAQADPPATGEGAEVSVRPEAEAAAPEGHEPPVGEHKPEPEAKQAEAPQYQSQAFAIRADGKDVTVPGAETRVFADGSRLHVLTDDALRRYIQPRLRDPDTVQKYRLESERQIAELKAAADPQNSPVVQSASKAMAFIEALLAEDLADGDAQDRVLNKLHQWKQGYPVWKAQQERDSERARADAILTARDSVQPEPDAYATEAAARENDERMGASLHGYLSTLLKDQKYQGVTQDSVTALMEDAWEQRHSFVLQADQDYPDHGLKKGDYFFDFTPLEKSLARARARDVKIAADMDALRKQVQDKIPEVAAVARENAAALGATRRPASGTRPTGERPTTKQKDDDEIPPWSDFKEAFMAADLLTDD